MNKKSLYNLIYRIRKARTDIVINTRGKQILFDYKNPESIQERKVQRLRSEFHFVAQSEIRS
jgi:hypothetical protein